MDEPTVLAVMLKNGREAMTARAVKAFQAQTYRHKRLLIWDTGELNEDFDTTGHGDGDVVHIPGEAYRKGPNPTIGFLRNEANSFLGITASDLICHWDSDDWSHPRRIEEQVALLQASGKQCVGYRDMLFWRGPLLHITAGKPHETRPGEAWLYSNNDPRYCLGTSLCYWRKAWEERAFPDLPRTFTAGRLKGKSAGNAEDLEWLREVDSVGVDSFPPMMPPNLLGRIALGEDFTPRMIASIHEGNTQDYSSPETSPSWRRVPEWDEHCSRVMAL